MAGRILQAATGEGSASLCRAPAALSGELPLSATAWPAVKAFSVAQDARVAVCRLVSDLRSSNLERQWCLSATIDNTAARSQHQAKPIVRTFTATA